MDYSSGVRWRFDNPRAPAPVDEAARTVIGTAADRSLNVWLRFVVAATGGRVASVRYNVYGCPHVIAACDRVAEMLEGQPISALRQLDLDRLSRELDVPREKFGKLLRIEDALSECAGQLEPAMEGQEPPRLHD